MSDIFTVIVLAVTCVLYPAATFAEELSFTTRKIDNHPSSPGAANTGAGDIHSRTGAIPLLLPAVQAAREVSRRRSDGAAESKAGLASKGSS